MPGQQDLEYATTNRGRAGVDLNAWKNTFVGTDLQDNLYLADPTNQHVKIFYFDKAIDSKGTLVTILNSTNKLNEVIYEKDYWVFTEGLAYKVIENVLAVSPSGKYFAYLNLNNRSDVGNYASIMLYNLNESDRVYTLNDQTKFKPYITKGFVTDKESEDLAKVWDKKTEEKKKQEEANADLKKKQEDAAKLERQAQYKPQLDALKLKITNAEAEFAAYKKPATDIYEAGNYQAVLENNHNQWYYSEHPFEIKDYSFTIKVKFERRGKDDVYAYVEESLQFPKSYIIDGKLAIVPDDEYNVVDNYKNYQYEGVKYVSSKYEGYIIETKGKGLSFQILGGQFQTGIEVLDRGEKFKKMGDRFLGFLDKAKLSVNINPSKNFWIGIESKTGYQIIIVAPEATEGMKLRQKVYELEQELEKLKAKIESGN